MTFIFYITYSQLERDIADNLGNILEGFYPTIEELKEYEGEDSNYTLIEIDDMMLEFDNCWVSFENIGMN